jgi:outer membrane protein TolC
MHVIPQASALPDPMFSYTYFIQQVETRVGPQRQRFSLAQMFPWFGTLRLRGDEAAKRAEAAWFDVQRLRLQLLHRVSRLYYDYYFLKRSTDITQQNFDLLKALESVARERYRTGQTLSAVVQAQVELGRLEDQLTALKDMRPALVAKLNAAMNRKDDAPLPWPPESLDPLPELDSQSVQNDLLVKNPDLARLTSLAETQRLAAELARKKGLPNITLGVSVIDTEDAVMPNVSDSGKDPVMATITLNLPIWRGKIRAAETEARLRRRALMEEKQDTADVLRGDAELALYHYRDAKRKIGLYEDTLLPKANQSFEVAQQAFQSGAVDFMTVVDAQRVLLEFQLQAAKARAEQGKRYAEIQMLTGTGSLPPPGTGAGVVGAVVRDVPDQAEKR